MRAIEPLYVAVYAPEFPAQALLRLRPDAAQDAVAVVAGIAPLEEVCSTNRHAARLGVTQGMTRAELDSFAGLRVLKQSAAEERTARAALLGAASVFTPRIEVVPHEAAAFLAVLDMTGSQRMFGATETMLDDLQQSLHALQLHVRLAASANFHAAVSVAPSATRKPRVLRAGDERRHLHTLPLAALPLSPVQAETLEAWGLRSLGELAQLPEADLIARLGQEGKRLRQLARGELPHLMVPEEEPLVLEEFLAFDVPLDLLDSLLFVLTPMLEQIFSRAASHAYGLARLTVWLALDGGGTHERTIKPALPLVDRHVALKLLHLDLQAHPPSAGILSVRLTGDPGKRSKIQQGLFAPPLPEATRLDVTLARIAALVGEERVGRARLLDMHRPDSFVMERFKVPTTLHTDTTPEHQAVSASLRRCRPARRVTVRSEQRRPMGFFLEGCFFTVEEAFGPWRKSGQWWNESVWSQEEWDVRARSGMQVLLCVLAENLLSREWHMVAMYD